MTDTPKTPDTPDTPKTPDAPDTTKRPETAELALPKGILACLFDLDGVVTRTAVVHAAAWKQTFDDFLRRRDGADFRPFHDTDYDEYVDGRPRADGVRTFLASRGIELPEGEPGDPPDAPTVHGLGNRKNELLLDLIRTGGVEAYEGTLRYLEAVRAHGLRTAIVSSSANCRDVLRSVGAEHYFDVRVDGVVAAERGLPGKPRPDTFLAAAQDLGVEPLEAAVFEDALAGMDAGRAGHFGYVVGVDRVGQGDALYAHGADRVVRDLAELLERP
ncbi:beta-phosphoglucomutase family hydrolase [Streptomyces phyllanthi]|uniref:Beta-phosphoglucomutase n=1 Tax=Streptomyces phyllanthi TaxID=1803180 RepID=A0A5N8W4X9_9ACTN|nr:beta-phosphoglucomutase family hydrolase [Streptomyces phyllanthi]MPY42537.1 beta-phosphoglucomutase family hydrolase [Streptomyces phyllanthi]